MSLLRRAYYNTAQFLLISGVSFTRRANRSHSRPSDDLLKQKGEQHKAGRTPPCKGQGLRRASDGVNRLFGAEKWPEPLATREAFGCGMANMLIDAYGARTLYSNYVTDMVFDYEHSYHMVIPGFENLIGKEDIDPHTVRTPAGAAGRLRRPATGTTRAMRRPSGSSRATNSAACWPCSGGASRPDL
ncbi:hypothetical protein DL763_006921 [Monosporascus cannonballus]|nr:hypothetical protein DL763_006921 [Monosporascus cannonballus]